MAWHCCYLPEILPFLTDFTQDCLPYFYMFFPGRRKDTVRPIDHTRCVHVSYFFLLRIKCVHCRRTHQWRGGFPRLSLRSGFIGLGINSKIAYVRGKINLGINFHRRKAAASSSIHSSSDKCQKYGCYSTFPFVVLLLTSPNRWLPCCSP